MTFGVAVVVLFGLLAAQAAAWRTPNFEDVSIASGLLSYDEMDKRKPYNNKYWGMSLGDVNRDGVYDLLLVNHGNNPDFYIGKEDGSYEYKNPKMFGKDVHSSAMADMDNDGYLDLVITRGGRNGQNVDGTPTICLGNENPPVFSREAGFPLGLGEIPMRGRSSSFLDMNADGFLDLLFVNKRNLSATEAHLLYGNKKHGNFELRKKTGIEGVNAERFALIDANDDSYMDVLLMTYFGVELWLGTGGWKFEDGNHLIPGGSELVDVRAAAEFDYDGDGDLDLIILAKMQKSEEAKSEDIIFKKTSSGYKMVSNSFSKIPSDGRHVHVTVGDLDNDGWTDMYISRSTDFEAPRVNDLLLMSKGDGTFKTVTTGKWTQAEGTDTDGDNGLIADLNGDGRADLLVGARNSEWKLYRNSTPRKSLHYVHVRVGAPRPELVEPEYFRRKALWAMVKVVCGSRTFVSRVGSPGQAHSQSYMDTLHFGLGTCTNLQRVEVHYTGDVVVTRTSKLAVDTLIEVGLYFPCPEGFTGAKCKTKVQPCSSNSMSCASGAACEVAELVRDKCDEERCSNGGGGGGGGGDGGDGGTSGPQLLKNRRFENDSAWKFAGSARYHSGFSFDGNRCAELPGGYASVWQDVELDARQQYELTCRVLEVDGPVRYIVRKDGAISEDDSSEGSPISGSEWKLKTMKFTSTSTGVYTVQFSTSSRREGAIDKCTLKRSSEGGCRASCLKMYCPV